MMKCKLAHAFCGLTACLMVSFVLVSPAYAAPSYTFDPANVSIQKDQSTTVTISINAEDQQVFGGDAVITYPTADIDVVSVTNGGYFNEVFSYSNSQENGKLEIHSFFSSTYTTRTGSGSFATLTLQAKKDSGGGVIMLNCTGEDSSSHILKSDLTNILDCSGVNQLAFSIGGGETEPTNTPIPTATTAPGEPTPTSTTAPAGPSYNPVCDFLAVDTNYGQAPLTVALVCAGSDPDDDIWTAEFDFGDGNKRTFTKNVGNSGSYTVDYVYSYAGTYYPTCRVGDLNSRYSEKRNVCQRTIMVTGTTKSPKTTSGIKPSPKPTKKPIGKPTTSIRPTPQVIELVDFIGLSPTPMAEIGKGTKKFDLPRIFLGLSIIASSLVIGGYIILKSRKDNTSPPNIPISQDF